MSANSIGRKFCITLFGESHGQGIGIVIDGTPCGLKIDNQLIQQDLDRRRPGKTPLTTPRKEKDEPRILSGINNGITSGGPITFFIENEDSKSSDYEQFRKIPRPSQIDYPALLRYGSNVDLRGSGKFSGRLTAGIVIAGAIAKMILNKNGIIIGAFIDQIGAIRDSNSYSVEQIEKNRNLLPIPVADPKLGTQMIEVIKKVQEESDSIGGCISVVVENFPAGVGDPWFHSLEGDIGTGVLSIPAVRGIEFGAGFQAVSMKGSEHNDTYILKNNQISTKTNYCGGIIGGISIGTPIKFRVAIKPTASIGKSQDTLNIETQKPTSLQISGRHDPCIVPRATVVIEAITAIVLVDQLLTAGRIPLQY